jgi:hypothetical protein
MKLGTRDIRLRREVVVQWAHDLAAAVLRRAEHDPRVLTGAREHYLLRIEHDVVICTDVFDEHGELICAYRYILEEGDYAWIQ